MMDEGQGRNPSILAILAILAIGFIQLHWPLLDLLPHDFSGTYIMATPGSIGRRVKWRETMSMTSGCWIMFRSTRLAQ